MDVHTPAPNSAALIRVWVRVRVTVTVIVVVSGTVRTGNRVKVRIGVRLGLIDRPDVLSLP